MGKIRKVTVDLDADVLDEFLKQAHVKLGIRKQNSALNVAMQAWLDNPRTTNSVSTEPSSDLTPSAGTIDPKYGQHHRMLDAILESGIETIRTAIISNLAAFEAFALVMMERTGGNTDKSAKPKKDTAANLDRARQAAIRSRVRLEDATESDRRGAKSPERKTGSG